MPQKKASLRLALNRGTLLHWVAWIIMLSGSVWAMSLVATKAPSTAESSDIFTENFERDFSGWDKQVCCSDSAQIVSSPTHTGEHAVKFTLRKSDPKVRAEIKLDPVPANSEQWYGFSVFFPKEYTKDPMHEVITQWHSRPDRSLGENWRRPALSIRTWDDKLKLVNHWDSRSVTPSRKGVDTQTWDLGVVPKGEWIDLVVHAKWSYKSDGLLEVWKNGKLVVRKTGPNTYNDKTGPFFKIGIYKRQWKNNPEESTTTKRVIYFNQVRVGDASASYEDVVPKSRSVSPISLRSLPRYQLSVGTGH